MTMLRAPLRQATRLVTPHRCFSLTAIRLRSIEASSSVLEKLEEQLHPRELVERKRKEMEAKYGDKLKARAQAEGVSDLQALKEKKMVPSVKTALKAKARAAEYQKQVTQDEEAETRVSPDSSAADASGAKVPEAAAQRGQAQAEARAQAKELAKRGELEDHSGIKPLSSIINLPLLHLTPHTPEQIAQIWNTFHISHATLANSYLAASLPLGIYESMISIARENPFFILPLPRDADPNSADTTVRTDEYEMFCLQWIFHAAPPAVPLSANPDNKSASASASASASPSPSSPLPRSASAILTPLEEYKKNGEWAQPYLTFTHYPDLGHSHDLVLMRGEISAASAGGPSGAGSPANPGWLLSQQQAQLLALAMQRFYCADIIPASETPQLAKERQERKDMLKGLRERPEEWDWTKLVHMAYGGMV